MSQTLSPSSQLLERDLSEPTPMQRSTQSSQSIRLKRGVTVKTLVTEQFKQNATTELSKELQFVEQQMEELEMQYQKMLRQLETLAQQSRNVRPELEQLNNDAQQKRAQLSAVKMELTNQLANLDKVENGSYIVTGQLENYVDISLGDNLFDKVRDAEILVNDGIVTAINA
jgi:chromosome segregation ATPase